MHRKPKLKNKISNKLKENSEFKEFVRRKVSSKDEIKKYEDDVRHEYREDQIEENLNTIYKDRKGHLIDVSRLNEKKKKSWFARLFRTLFFLIIFAILALGAYWYFFQYNTNSEVLNFSIIAPETVITGEEFNYKIEYSNLSRVGIKNLNLEVIYPENFIFLTSSMISKERNSVWEIPYLPAGEKGEIIITGKILAKTGSPNTIKLSMTYMPENFSSNFKKDISSTILVENLGFSVNVDYVNTALVAKEEKISLSFTVNSENYVDSLDLVFILPDNIEVSIPKNENNSNDDIQSASSSLSFSSQKRHTWNIEGLGQEDVLQDLSFNFLVKDKISETQDFTLQFYARENDTSYLLAEELVNLKIMKSDLNLSLLVNDSKNGEAVNFGEDLNYSVFFSNQGEISLEDVTVMVVIDGDFLNWSEINDENGGEYNNNSIAWSKEHIEKLSEIAPGDEGTINFSLPISNFNLDDLDKSLEIKSYAQFNFKSDEDLDLGSDNQSNTVLNLINSDLEFEEKVLYFTEDNLPVGSGPLPPKVDQTTKFKAYWQISNNVHNLSQLRTELKLPSYIEFDQTVSVDKGFLNYDKQNRLVSWDIEEINTSDYLLEAQFYLSLKPVSDDVDKILVISPGASLSALDNVTNDKITKKSEATTSKLEEDEIANLSSDGRVVN